MDVCNLSSGMSIQILQSIAYYTGIVVLFLFHVFLKDNGPHEATWGAATSKQFELGETLLWKNIKPIESDPTSMGQAADLLHQRGVKRFVSQLQNVCSKVSRKLLDIGMEGIY